MRRRLQAAFAMREGGGPWRRRRLRWLLVAFLLTLALGAGWWGTVRDSSAGLPYRYRFERSAPGSVRQALHAEIAFLQARIRRDPAGGLDLAALSGSYVRMARATGDLTWYLLAEQAARRSLAALPYGNDAALLTLGRVAEARHDFPAAMRLARMAGASPDGLAILVTSSLAQGRLDVAARTADMLVGMTPGLGSYALRALVASAQGRDEAAVADFHRALALEESGEAGSSAWVRTLLGRVHSRRGRHADAAVLYREALRILPQYPPALLNLAELEMRRGRYGEAERHLTQVVSLTRESPNAYDHAVFRGLARLHLLRGHVARANAFWAEAEGRLRRDVTAGQFGHRRELARLLLERGRPEDAEEAMALMAAEARVRQDAETLEVYAWALSRAGRWTDAGQAIEGALRWGGREARTFYRAALIEEARGRPARAAHFLALMSETDPTFDARAREILGVVER